MGARMSAPRIETLSPYTIPKKDPVRVEYSEEYGWRVLMGKWLDAAYDDEETAIDAGRRQAAAEYTELHIYER
jgi:hypothetical protein